MESKKVQKTSDEPRRRGSCIWIILIAAVAISIIAIVGFNKVGKVYALNLDTTVDINCVEVNRNTDNSSLQIKSYSFIKDITKQLDKVNATGSKTASISDLPVVDEYYELTFVSADKKEKVYVYQKDEKYFVEEPYNAIFEISKDSYDIIISLIESF